MNSRNNHGRHSEDTKRDERWKEVCRQEHLHSESGSGQGSLDRETSRKRDRILFIENLSNRPPSFIVRDAETTDELLNEVIQRFPRLVEPHVHIEIYTNRCGSMIRREVKGLLPYDLDSLYIKVSSRK